MSVNATVPDETSAALGVYVAVGEVALLNVPVPEVTQVTDDAPPPNEPASVTAAPLQEVLSGPAFTTGALLTTILAVDVGL